MKLAPYVEQAELLTPVEGIYDPGITRTDANTAQSRTRSMATPRTTQKLRR